MKSLLLILILFPFTKLLPLETYNQPYAVAFALLLLVFAPSSILRVPAADRWALTYFMMLGVAMFVWVVPRQAGARELQYLLIYITPFIIVPMALTAISSRIELARKILTLGIVVWAGVGAVQFLYDPNFLTFLVSSSTELGSNIVDSGRGVLSLAPEPTHFGLHIIALGASLYLLRGPTWAVALAILSSLLLARSSFALLVLALGALAWVMLSLRRWPLLLLAAGAAYFAQIVATTIFPEDSRIGRLLAVFTESGRDVLLDYSVNARLYGIYAPIAESFSGFLVPLGIHQDDWLQLRDIILAENPQIINLSTSGAASGYGIVLVQAGLLGLPAIIYFFRRICLAKIENWQGFIGTSGFFVFMGQLNLSTPTFSLLLAAAIYATMSKTSRQPMQNYYPPMPRQAGQYQVPQTGMNHQRGGPP